jgi:hypothetical protein
MEKILDVVYQDVQDGIKKFQDTKNMEHEKTWKQINELREDFCPQRELQQISK